MHAFKVALVYIKIAPETERDCGRGLHAYFILLQGGGRSFFGVAELFGLAAARGARPSVVRSAARSKGERHAKIQSSIIAKLR